MANHKERIEHLKPIESDLDFQAIYELGRHLSLQQLQFEMQPLSEIQSQLEVDKVKSERIIQNAKTFFLKLADDILYKQLKFPSILIDFVLFYLADVTGRRFYIAVCSINNSIVEKYKEQVRKNISGDDKDTLDEKRRPILTNPEIYTSPYFYKGPEERHDSSFKKFKRIDEQNIAVHFGCFYKKRDNPLKLNEQAKLIEEFFDLIEDGLDTETRNGKDIFNFNTSILIPLMRPAASYAGEHKNKFNGGGVFIYGQTEKKANDDIENHINNVPEEAEGSAYMIRKAARLKYFFERKILETSHTQIAIEKQKEKQSFIELNLFHHFDSNMRGLPDKLSFEKFKVDNLTAEQKYLLQTTSDYIRNYIDNTTNLLSSYQQTFDKTREELVSSYLKPLTDLKAQKAEHTEVQILFDDSLNGYKTKVPYNIFCNYCEQLTNNAIKEYAFMGIPFEKRKVEIHLKKQTEEGKDYLLVDVINSETNLTDSVILMNAGLKPIKSYNSSGVGFYFLNFSLQLLGAKKISDEDTERYFTIENESDPKKLKISFCFPIKK